MTRRTSTRSSLKDELFEITARLLALQTKDGKISTRRFLDGELLEITARVLELQVQEFPLEPSLQEQNEELKANVKALRSQTSDKDQQIFVIQSELRDLKLQIPSREKLPKHIRVRLPPPLKITTESCQGDFSIPSQQESSLPAGTPCHHGSSASSSCSSSSSIFSRENPLETDSIHDEVDDKPNVHVCIDSVRPGRVLRRDRWLLQPQSQFKRHQRMLKEHENSAANSCRSFTLFSALPLDIQKKIWRHTLPSSRIVEICWCPKSETYRSYCPPPVTLQVCQASRNEVLLAYQKLDPDSFKSIYIDFKSDTLLLSSGDLDYFWAFTYLRIYDQLREIQHLAIEIPAWKDAVEKSWFLEFLLEMTSLEELSIVWGSFKKPRASYFGHFPPLPPSCSSVFEALEKERKLHSAWDTIIPKLRLVSAKRSFGTGSINGRIEKLRVFKYEEAMGNHGFWSIEEDPRIRLEQCMAVQRGFILTDL
jgi:hypothetical protein